jgi:hypothetical protein
MPGKELGDETTGSSTRHVTDGTSFYCVSLCLGALLLPWGLGTVIVMWRDGRQHGKAPPDCLPRPDAVNFPSAAFSVPWRSAKRARLLLPAQGNRHKRPPFTALAGWVGCLHCIGTSPAARCLAGTRQAATSQTR